MKFGAEIEVRNGDNATPLHLAAKYSRTETAKLLMDRGAEIGAKAVSNQTPLHFAAWTNSKETAKLLSERSAEMLSRE